MKSSRRTRTAASSLGLKRSSSLVLAGVVFAWFLSPAAAQETQAAKKPEQVADALLGPSPTVRKQALNWARDHAAEVVPALVRALEVRPATSFAFEGIRALGEIKDPRLSAAIAAVCAKPDFPWKPQALEALADHAFQGAIPLFMRHVEGPSIRGRAACIRGIAALGIEEMDPILAEALGDDEASVRIEAARGLIKLRNEYSGVPVIVRDLSLDRRFGTFDPGLEAREAAAAFLKELGATATPSPVPVASAVDLASKLKELRTVLGERGAFFPETLAPHEPDSAASFRYAVEVRSCPDGEIFLRVDPESGQAVFGRDLLRTFTVDKKLLETIARGLDGMNTGGKDGRGERRIIGPVSCDLERLAVRDSAGWRTLVIGTGRADPSLDAVEAAILAVVRQARGEPEAERHARRMAAFQPASRPASRADSRPSGDAR